MDALLARHPLPDKYAISYGTAGFRGPVNAGLRNVFVKIGLVAWVRAMVTGKAVGLMITASHNACQDNGAKLIDTDGGMLAQSWEEIATRVANAKDFQEIKRLLKTSLNVDVCDDDDGDKGSTPAISSKAIVYVARDTREHSQELEDLATSAIRLVGGRYQSFGLLTTPQLHFIVMERNKRGNGEETVTEVDYYKWFSESFASLVASAPPREGGNLTVAVDCANGVGALKFPPFLPTILSSCGVKVELFNTNTKDFSLLNKDCGAEHVQKTRTFPRDAPLHCDLFASFDGDADRIVFYYRQGNGGGNKDESLVLLDGDKIAALLAMFIKERTSTLGLDSIITTACVQTAYSNGSSRDFFQRVLGISAPLVKTGVKYLHHEAVKYDVGIYFEANGHGTVIFSDKFKMELMSINTEETSDAKEIRDRKNKAKNELMQLYSLINQATGDAMSDFLASLAVLLTTEFSRTGNATTTTTSSSSLSSKFNAWNDLYSDLPSRQLKVKVKDRTLLKTVEDESRCLEPASLQQAIDALVARFSGGEGKPKHPARAFARPSGTEDVVRVYAEASTQAKADELADLVALAIFDHAQGVGDRSQFEKVVTGTNGIGGGDAKRVRV